MARKIKKNDEVIVIAGRSKGVRGSVLKVLDGGERLLVDGVNMIKKHVRPNPQLNKPGGIVDMESPIHISNVAFANPLTGKEGAAKKPTSKVGFKTLPNGKKVRYYKVNGELIDVDKA